MPVATTQIQPGRPVMGTDGASSGFLGGFNPDQTFGPYTGPRGDQHNEFTGAGYPNAPPGAGVYGLPIAYNGWSPAARAAIPVASGYERGISPLLKFLQGEMGRDISGELFSRSQGIIDSNQAEGRRVSQNEMTKSGYRGATAQSPFAALQLQMESAARGGALGQAARQSVLAAQERKLQIAPTIQQMLASLSQAWLVPSQIQAGSVSRAPIGSVGPSYLPAGISSLAALLQAGAG